MKTLYKSTPSKVDYHDTQEARMPKLSIKKELLVDMLSKMFEIRFFEEKIEEDQELVDIFNQ